MLPESELQQRRLCFIEVYLNYADWHFVVALNYVSCLLDAFGDEDDDEDDEDEDEDEDNDDEYESMGKRELRKECKARGLDAEGTRKHMRERLRAHDKGVEGGLPEEEAYSNFIRQQLRTDVDAPRRCRHFYTPQYFREWREESYEGEPQLWLPWTRHEFSS